jgi:hypothetical protein
MMPPVIPQHLEVAKKRMRQGLHPAVLAAVARSLTEAPTREGQVQAYNQRQGRIDLGTAVNQTPVVPGGNVEAAQTRAGQRYRTLIERAAGNKIRELHVYGSGQNRQVMAFNRAPSAALTARLQSALGQQKTVPSVAQHLSNTATAEDKMIALAHKAAAGKLAAGVGSRRRFSSKPGPMQRY